MKQIVILVRFRSGTKQYYEFSSFNEFSTKYEFLRENCKLQCAIIKEKVWKCKNDWSYLYELLESMCW